MKNRVEAQIRVNGTECELIKMLEGKYKQPSNEEGEGYKFAGLYHTGNSYITIKDTVGIRGIHKQDPRVLFVLTDDFKPCINDILVCGGKKYRVNGMVDIGNLGVVGDISLEVIADAGCQEC